jgi:hypothetical protein
MRLTSPSAQAIAASSHGAAFKPTTLPRNESLSSSRPNLDQAKELKDRQELTALVGRQNVSTRLDQTAEPDSVISFRALREPFGSRLQPPVLPFSIPGDEGSRLDWFWRLCLCH